MIDRDADRLKWHEMAEVTWDDFLVKCNEALAASRNPAALGERRLLAKRMKRVGRIFADLVERGYMG